MPGRCEGNPDWTEAEDAVIHRMWPTATDKEIARELPGRTWGAVHKRRQKLGYYRGRHAEHRCGMLPKDAAPILGDPKDRIKKCPLALAPDVAKPAIHGVLTGAFSAEAAMLAVMQARGLRHG